MATHHPIRKTVAHPAPVIPDKLYFRIGDVARICEVPAYVLRFWETEFPNLKPNKGGTGQRLYRRKEVETALRIKHLLYDLGYTIPGARQVFKNDAKPDAKPAAEASALVPASEAPTAEASAPTATSAARKEAVILSAARNAPSKDTDAAEPTMAAGTFSAAALHTLRDELRALHTQLSAPVSAAVSEPAPAPLRPHLVAEARPRPRLHKPEPRLEPRLGPIALAGQQDLFPVE